MQWLPFALTVVIGAPPTQAAWVTPAPGPQYGQAQAPNPIGPPAPSPVALAPGQRPKQNTPTPTPIDPPYGDAGSAPRGNSNSPAPAGKLGAAQPAGQFGNPATPAPTPAPYGPANNGSGNPNGKFGAAQPGGQLGDVAPMPYGPGHAGHGTPNGGKFGTAQPGGAFGDPQPGTDTPSPFPNGKFGTAQPGGQLGDVAPMPYGPGHAGHGTPNGGKFGTAQPGGAFGDPQPGGDGDSNPNGKFGASLPSGHFDNPTPPLPFGSPDGPQEVEQTFNLLVTDASWDELLGVVQYPGLLKSARMEVSVEGRWTLLTESLSSLDDPPVTEVMYQGRATVNSAGRDLMATGNIQHSLQTRFDGLWDWKGPSGEFGTTTCATDVAVIELPPSKFEGAGTYNMSIGGALSDSYQVLGDSAETAVKILGGARVTVRFVFEPK